MTKSQLVLLSTIIKNISDQGNPIQNYHVMIQSMSANVSCHVDYIILS